MFAPRNFCVRKRKRVQKMSTLFRQPFSNLQTPTLYPADTHRTPFRHPANTRKTATKFQISILHRTLISNQGKGWVIPVKLAIFVPLHKKRLTFTKSLLEPSAIFPYLQRLLDTAKIPSQKFPITFPTPSTLLPDTFQTPYRQSPDLPNTFQEPSATFPHH